MFGAKARGPRDAAAIAPPAVPNTYVIDLPRMSAVDEAAGRIPAAPA
jgi:hypothetical protein